MIEVQQGLCGVLLQGDRLREQARQKEGDEAESVTNPLPGAVYGVSFSHEEPGRLVELISLDDVDIVALEGCEKQPSEQARWHSLRVQLDPVMANEGLLTWVEGTDPFLTARLFAKYEGLNASVVLPLYSLIVARNNAVRGRNNNQAPPPWRIPAHLEPDFTMDGRVRVAHHYVDESAAEARDHYSFGFYRASRSQIDGLVRRATSRESNYYGETDQFLYEALDKGAAAGVSLRILGVWGGV